MTCEHLTCLHYKARQTALDDYWVSPAGISRRIDSLSQDFSFRVCNKSVRVIGEKNGARWIRWEAMEDDRLCDECMRRSRQGRNGFFRMDWFMPAPPPVHPNCRCQLRVYFYEVK